MTARAAYRGARALEYIMGPLYGVPATELVRIAGAHLVTARRWKRAASVPAWLTRLVRLLIYGELDDISATWTGWRIVRGDLVSPEGWKFTMGEIRALPFMHAQIANYRAQQRLPAQADMFEANWQRLPGALQRDAAPTPRGAVVDLFNTAGSQRRK